MISLHFNTTGPLHSPDITPCDFRLWGSLKDNIYSRKPVPVVDLKDRIRSHVFEIRADSFRYAVENAVLRLGHIVKHEGGHIEQFK